MPGHGARERRRALRQREVSKKNCEVPGCGGRALKDEEGYDTDCCFDHSLPGDPGGGQRRIENDGIIDWLAIELAATGVRKPKLTWVEKDIAVGVVLASGQGITAAEELVGTRVCGNKNGRRVKAAEAIAEALMATSNQEA